jgi:hypothetical protein
MGPPAQKVSTHGVRIDEVSSVHASFTKASGIPADDLTRSVVTQLRKKHDDALKQDPIFGSMASMPGEMGKRMRKMAEAMNARIPLDGTFAGLWLTSRLDAIRAAHIALKFPGDAPYPTAELDQIQFDLGRLSACNPKQCWPEAAKMWRNALKKHTPKEPKSKSKSQSQSKPKTKAKKSTPTPTKSETHSSTSADSTDN